METDKRNKIMTDICIYVVFEYDNEEKQTIINSVFIDFDEKHDVKASVQEIISKYGIEVIENRDCKLGFRVKNVEDKDFMKTFCNFFPVGTETSYIIELPVEKMEDVYNETMKEIVEINKKIREENVARKLCEIENVDPELNCPGIGRIIPVGETWKAWEVKLERARELIKYFDNEKED